MTDPSLAMTVPFHANYLNVKDNKQFPVSVIERLTALNKVLKVWGMPLIDVCGVNLSIRESVWGGHEVEFKPYNAGGPWKNVIQVAVSGEKRFVISIMCTMIALENEDYIHDIFIHNLDKDEEILDLWQTAWNIIIEMQGGEYENNEYLDD